MFSYWRCVFRSGLDALKGNSAFFTTRNQRDAHRLNRQMNRECFLLDSSKQPKQGRFGTKKRRKLMVCYRVVSPLRGGI
jgi:hypothetical protein